MSLRTLRTTELSQLSGHAFGAAQFHIPHSTFDIMKRMHYMDLLKGIAIFMVVMGHVLTICIRDIDAATLFKIIGETHMPIFFFISGWFTYKAQADGRIRRPDLRRRAMQLIVPMVVVSSLWVLYFPYSGLKSPMAHGFDGLWCAEYKNGYWFTPVLFVIMALYALLAPAILRLRRAVAAVSVTLIISITLYACIEHFLPIRYIGITSALLILQFFPIFMVGAIARQHQDAFMRLIATPRAVTGALTAGVALFFIIAWPWRFPALDGIPFIVPAAKMLFHIALAIVAMNIAVPLSDKAYAAERTRPGRLTVILEYLGRKSLAIYLLHYFFLFPMTFLQDPARDMALSIVPLSVIAAATAAAIVAATLAAEYLLSRSPLAARLFCGDTHK